MVSLVDYEKWAPLIGRCFIAFGSIEQSINECIEVWSNKAIYKHIRQMGLTNRIELAIDLVQLQQYSDQNKEKFIDDFKSAKVLIEKRNIMAHSPLALVLFEEDDSPFTEAIISYKGKTIEYDDLEGIVLQARQIAEDIHQNMAAFRIDKIDFEAIEEFGGLQSKASSSVG